MNWDTFPYYAIVSMILSLGGAILALLVKTKPVWSHLLYGMAILVFGIYIAGFWIELERPPMRTMGETRLWYSFFVFLAGWIVYTRWKYTWVLLFTTVLSSVFSLLNILKPEIHDQTLVPALQSVFFIPHVTVYMFAYGILACAFILAMAGIFDKKRQYFASIDNLVYIGTGLLFIGMLTGMIWAKQAWGDFWDWDPKETWAAVTIAGYLMYIHLRLTGSAHKTWLYVVVIVSFLMLQMCWYGYKYLPSSMDSMHLYNVN